MGILNRFKYERFKKLASYSNYWHFNGLEKVSEILVPYALGDAANAKAVMTQAQREQIRKVGEGFKDYLIFYQRFMELEEIYQYELCYRATKDLAEIDITLSDAKYMACFTHNVLLAFVKPTQLDDRYLDQDLAQKLEQIYEHWVELARLDMKLA